jgi:ATP-dependent Clp protease ATP-binding subunit ClpX
VTNKPNRVRQCSFCGRTPDKVRVLISAPKRAPGGYICDECIAVCNSILEDDRTGIRRDTSDAELTLRSRAE